MASATGDLLTTDDEQAALERARTASHLLDDAIQIPGTKISFGLDPILSIAPVSGDVAGALCALYVVFEGYRIGLPNRELGKMLGLIGVEMLVGSVPVLGTIVDAVWKVNRRNFRVIERHVEDRQESERLSTDTVTAP